MCTRTAALVPLAAVLALGAAGQQEPTGLAKAGTAKVSDAFRLMEPTSTELGGLLGARFRASARERLRAVDEDEMLAGFRHKPGKQAWIGEHAGKFLHAATLAWAATGDAALRAKIDRVAAGLIASQEPDGYLGTYVPGKRFGQFPDADWDVWVHKYDLVGLLTYHQYTRSRPALEACRKIGDLLLTTFGSGGRSILSAGTHLGMAATSVLEPIVLLYRATGDSRYLAFARRIVAAWDEAGGPAIISSLKRERRVSKVANGKAYEMLSNLVGLCELYRATGERAYLEPVLIAWDDIARRRLYVTGSGSSFEVWHDYFDLPNGEGANICETCVTVTWMQLNLQLLRLTGEARFADQLERTTFNHLLGAQKPTGEAWCYYTPLQGRKPYGTSTSCCLSSGPRAIALLPTWVYARTSDGVALNAYTPSRATLDIPGGPVGLLQRTQYPVDGKVILTVTPRRRPLRFAVHLRIPAWAEGATYLLPGTDTPLPARPGQYVAVTRTWRPGDEVVVDLPMAARLVRGEHGNAGRAVVEYGPLVLAMDQAHNPDAGPVSRLRLSADDEADFSARRVEVPAGDDEPVFETPGLAARAGAASGATALRLVPFYQAGQGGSRLVVWLPLRGSPGSATAASGSLFAWADERRSRQGNQSGSITDDDRSTFAVTFDGRSDQEDWYSVELPAPVTVGRVVFCHGHTFHDGGWFDTSRSKPRVQVRRTRTAPWQDVATLDGYPSTTATAAPALEDGQAFSATFAPVEVVAVRVVGRPSCGDNAAQAFSSCAELQAFAGP